MKLKYIVDQYVNHRSLRLSLTDFSKGLRRYSITRRWPVWMSTIPCGRKYTAPAECCMQAGVANHIWSIEEIIGLLDSPR
jgi:hypothetical protein